YNLNCCENVIIEHNRIVGADLMSTGGSYACYGPEGYSRNIFTAHNHYENMHGWDREAFTSDAGGGAYFGKVAQCHGNELVLASDPNWRNRDWHNALVAIVHGRGRGQWRLVRAWSGRRVMLDRPFDVAPDENSQVTITMLHQRYIFYGNEFRDVGIAIQFYGTAIEHVVANNRCWRAGGYHALGIPYAGGIQPDFYVQFIGNEIVEGNSYRFGANNATLAGPSHIGVYGSAPSINFGCIVRENHLHNNARIEISGRIENVVIEGNVIERASTGIRIDEGCANVLLRNNRFVECAREVWDVAAVKRKWRTVIEQLAERREPLAHWSFDEPARVRFSVRTVISDIDLTARAVGGVRIVKGVRGNAIEFDGKSHLVIGESEEAQYALNLRNFTITAWISPKRVTGRSGIIAKRVGNTLTPFVICVHDGKLTFDGADRNGKWTYNCSSPQVLKPNQWQHIAVVVEEAKRVVLYVNGREVRIHKVTEPLCANEQPLIVGRDAWGGEPPRGETPGFFIGAIDELKIWA
ncbi:MAG TPA: LamG domain-containing protein, partial [Armatimonadetes bacterium]|nr:LamG domain-containing protein [Armatimonadota bacterium]